MLFPRLAIMPRKRVSFIETGLRRRLKWAVWLEQSGTYYTWIILLNAYAAYGNLSPY